MNAWVTHTQQPSVFRLERLDGVDSMALKFPSTWGMLGHTLLFSYYNECKELLGAPPTTPTPGLLA